MPATKAVRNLKEFGLIAKPPEPMAAEAALGLKLQRDRLAIMVFRKGNEIPELGTNIRGENGSRCLGNY